MSSSGGDQSSGAGQFVYQMFNYRHRKLRDGTRDRIKTTMLLIPILRWREHAGSTKATIIYRCPQTGEERTKLVDRANIIPAPEQA